MSTFFLKFCWVCGSVKTDNALFIANIYTKVKNIHHLWHLCITFMESWKCTFQRCAKMMKFDKIFDHILTMSTKQGIFYNYWIDLVTLNKFDFIKSSENWGKKCLLGLTNIWSNRGHCVRLSWKFILHAKISLSQHSRTTFKPDLTYKFLPLRVIYFFPTWGGWPCKLQTKSITRVDLR